MKETTCSIVVPVFNEQAVVDEFCRRLGAVTDGMGERCEVIFVDDGSTDSTFERLCAQARKNPAVRVVRLSRNFGHQIALTAGMDAATGDAVIVMDGDLQHPPELIPELVAKWREGYNVVNTERRETVGIPVARKLFSNMFYWLINLDSEVPIPAGAADFRLMDSAAAAAFGQLREQDRFVRGLTGWIGFRQTSVPYTAPARHAGASKYSAGRMVRFAANGLTSFSTLPLKAVGLAGLVVSFLSFVYAVYALYVHLVLKQTVQGWTSLLVAVLFLGGVQLISISVLGAYIARIFRQVKGRPLYLVQDRVGWDGAPDGDGRGKG